ncbi:MAG TPA: twin-arginine translocase TatA/TatE family subunit [Croceibacterium sp.]|nr:twin-arginine translocase TatA/TatE family subunit [Croceibacterium sp.]
MHLPGLFQILVIGFIALVLFGRGRISEFMGDFGKGVKNFRRNLEDEPVRPMLEASPASEAAAEPVSARDETSN